MSFSQLMVDLQGEYRKAPDGVLCGTRLVNTPILGRSDCRHVGRVISCLPESGTMEHLVSGENDRPTNTAIV